MAIANITDLGIQAAMWSDRQDITAELMESFVGNVTGKLNRILRLPEQEEAGTILAYGGGIEIPRNFIGLRMIQGAHATLGSEVLQYVPQDVLQSYVNSNRLFPGTTYFSRIGRFWRMYPVAPDGAPYLVNYYATLPELTQTVPTTWLLEKYPQLYLYGLIEQIYMYTMDQERTLYWRERFETAAKELQDEADLAYYSGSRLAIKEITRG
ncbi:hypothetical protein B5P22_31155 [Pseudomonas tolaasii]|uniref:phage adaptor protein n=1 Tax=Pseudomonas tolaasii TaxID=29442 RepID=UPI0009B6D414|nr:hypothetical protein [Pseudomonas tolaasii]ARB31566.1 hypothetical protein B5P22_31155 [Pseudomonas tolaasii]